MIMYCQFCVKGIVHFEGLFTFAIFYVFFQNVHMELEDIDERIQYLDNIKNSSAYVKKRKNVKMMLEQFLQKIPGSPTLLSITPHDIKRF